MATMNISLPEEMKALVEERVKAGLYANVSDYVRDLIRDDLSGIGDWLTSEVASAIEEAEVGGYSEKSLDQVFAEAKTQFRSN